MFFGAVVILYYFFYGTIIDLKIVKIVILTNRFIIFETPKYWKYMGHWLEEIENQAEKQHNNSEKAHNRIEERKQKVILNYEANKTVYDSFIAEMNSFVDRVNKLPEDQRVDFEEIDRKYKSTIFNNKLNIYSSSKRVEIRKRRGLLRGYKNYRYKYIRVIYFSIAKEYGKVEIEIKEKYLPKGHRKTHKAGTIKKLFKSNFSVLTHELCLELIDWLAFKDEIRLKQFE